jgi:hypothetical protein
MVKFKHNWSDLAGRKMIKMPAIKSVLKKKAKNISLALLIFLLVGFCFSSGSAFADFSIEENRAGVEDALPNQAEEILFDLINSARQNPLDAIMSAGMDVRQIFEENSDIADILENGLPALEFSSSLHRAAKMHAQDMLENDYYDFKSLDGATIDERIARAGYVPVTAGEHLGMIFFNNFVSSENAAAWIFQNMLQDELAPDRSGPRKIFNPATAEAGPALCGGAYQIGQTKANAYIGVCDFARPVEKTELILANLINQLRNDPWPVLEHYGFEIEKDQFPELETLLDQGGLPPLMLNLSLYSAAEALVADMFENNHCNPYTSDGKGLEERVLLAGYDEPSWLGEARSRFVTCGEAASHGEIARRLFFSLLKAAFASNSEERNNSMLAPWARDFGIKIMEGVLEGFGSICGNNMQIMVADFGAKMTNQDTSDADEKSDISDQETADPEGVLIGLVYEDFNKNNIYDPGEGFSEAMVSIENGDGAVVGTQKIFTNPAGGFDLRLPQGRYLIKIDTYDCNLGSKWVDIQNNDFHWLSLSVYPCQEQSNASEELL